MEPGTPPADLPVPDDNDQDEDRGTLDTALEVARRVMAERHRGHPLVDEDVVELCRLVEQLGVARAEAR